MGKLPASLFYWGDFVRDPNVRRCTHAEAGVWIRILCLMFDAETKGILESNGVPWTDEEICMAVGGKYEETLQAVTALVAKGVASRSDRGSLMNRRMYREELAKQQERAATRERVHNHRTSQANNAGSNAECNGAVTPSVTEVKRRCTETEYETETVTRPLKPDLEGIYAEYPRKIGKSGALKAISKAFDRLVNGHDGKKLDPEAANAFLRLSVQQFARSPAGRAGEFTPHPATWFNDSRYLDDPQEWDRRANGFKSKDQRTLDALTASLAGDNQGRTHPTGDFATGGVIEGGAGPVLHGIAELGHGGPASGSEVIREAQRGR